MIGGAGLQAVERDAHLTRRRRLLRIVDGGVWSGAVAHATLLNTATRGLRADNSRIRCHGRHGGCRNVGVVGLLRLVVATTATSSKCHGQTTAHAKS